MGVVIEKLKLLKNLNYKTINTVRSPLKVSEQIFFRNDEIQTDVHDVEEEILCDAKQAGPYSHNQQNQSAERMDGEIQSS